MNVFICETEHYILREVQFELKLVIGVEVSYYMLVNRELPTLVIIIPYEEYSPQKVLQDLDELLQKFFKKYISPKTIHKSGWTIRNWLVKNVVAKGERNGKK